MKQNFIQNVSRIKRQAKEYIGKLARLSLPKKTLIIFLAFLTVPNLQFTILILVPALITLLFINDSVKGPKRGAVSFGLATFTQLFAIVMLFLGVGFHDPTEGLDILSKLGITASVTLGGIILLLPGYILALLLYDIKLKKPEGKVYMMMFGGLAILLAIRTTFMVLF